MRLHEFRRPGQHIGKLRQFLRLHQPKVAFRQVRSARRGKAPRTSIPAASIPARTSASCRGDATLFSTTPASRTSARMLAKPRATAAADCACPDTSSTKHHRPAHQGRDIGAGAVARLPGAHNAVKQPHRTLGHDDIGPRRRLCRDAGHDLPAPSPKRPD
jgi:hypothetical protein